eukprot:259161-Lingulodinium_polyedra.AAC.1
MGFRLPNVEERARISGAAAYWHSLDLETLELYKAQGNHFDRHCITMRFHAPLASWARGALLTQPQCPALHSLET